MFIQSVLYPEPFNLIFCLLVWYLSLTCKNKLNIIVKVYFKKSLSSTEEMELLGRWLRKLKNIILTHKHVSLSSYLILSSGYFFFSVLYNLLILSIPFGLSFLTTTLIIFCSFISEHRILFI